MRRAHEEEERPFDPDKPPTWRGSSRDLVANGPRLRENPDRFFDELNDLVDRYGRTLRTDPEEVKRELKELFGGRGNAFKKLKRADELLEGHGVESFGNRYSYINFGDAYDPTIIYDEDEDKFFVSSWGDVEETRQQGAEEDAWSDWIEGEFTNRLEALCEDKPQALAALEAIPEEKLESLFHEALRETPNAEIVHESDGSVFVSKFDQVVQTAYRMLESGKFRSNGRASTLERDGTLQQLLEMERESAESPVEDSDLEITEELSQAVSDYEDELYNVLSQVVQRFPPKDRATAQELFDAEAPYLVLMTLRGEGVGIWDGRWDNFYDDTKPVERFLKKELGKYATDAGSGRIEMALQNAVYDAEQRTGATREENRRPNARRVAARNDPNHAFSLRIPGSLIGDKPIMIDSFAVPKRDTLHHRGFEIEVRQGGKVIFPRGQLYYGTPNGHEQDDDYSKAMAVELAAMKNGDTDDEFFTDAKYTDDQMRWAEDNSDNLRLYSAEKFGEF